MAANEFSERELRAVKKRVCRMGVATTGHRRLILQQISAEATAPDVLSREDVWGWGRVPRSASAAPPARPLPDAGVVRQIGDGPRGRAVHRPRHPPMGQH